MIVSSREHQTGVIKLIAVLMSRVGKACDACNSTSFDRFAPCFVLEPILVGWIDWSLYCDCRYG
jgi:hypothetical protein